MDGLPNDIVEAWWFLYLMFGQKVAERKIVDVIIRRNKEITEGDRLLKEALDERD